MSLLNNPFALIATASLTIQIVVLFLLSYGYLLKRHLRFREHGKAMFIAVVLHLSTVFTVMIPSFVLAIVPNFILPNSNGITSVVTLVMLVTGTLAVSLGVWLVVSWRFHDWEDCVKRKRIMITTMAAWLVSLSFGIVLYSILYWAALTG
ncbi:MAG: hypothetical protein ABSD92_05490 [Candidatus Bathyarchaeia archaeon]|jgi:uncharacterized membrane protein YozB (DUF420 family)